MDQEPEPTFPVERIIALKRHEQPPPGYFDLLPGRIMRRIEQGDGQFGFWARWRPSFSARPVLAFAVALAYCGTLSVAIYSPPKMDRTVAAEDLLSQDLWAAASASSLQPEDTSPIESGWLGSTNPVTAPQTGDSPFSTPAARAIPVSLFQPN